MKSNYNGIKFKPFSNNRYDVHLVSTITGSRKLPLGKIENEFKRIFTKFKLMGYSSFADFTESDLSNICSKLYSMLDVNSCHMYCEVIGSDAKYLRINLPLTFLLGVGFNIAVNQSTNADNSVHSSINIYRYKQMICNLCSLDGEGYDYVGVGMDENGKLGFLICKYSYSYALHQSFVLTEFSFTEFIS